jgi:hypothetical protein
LVDATNPALLGAALTNASLLTSSVPGLKRTTTNAAGQYVFVVQPGRYLVLPIQPGVYFALPFRQATLTTASAAHQDFIGAGVDATAPAVTITTAGPTAATGSATDGGGGVLTVVATLQNSAGQYLNWLGTGTTAQFTVAPVVGSFRLATVPGRTVVILNTAKVTSQNWSVLLPAVLPAGSYRLTMRAVDRAFRVSLPVARIISKGSAALTMYSAVALSSATASAVRQSVTLRFGGALDAESAAAADHYRVAVNGRALNVESAGYDAGTHGVTLGLADAALHSGDAVTVQWADLQDANGQTVSGQAGAVPAR